MRRKSRAAWPPPRPSCAKPGNSTSRSRATRATKTSPRCSPSWKRRARRPPIDRSARGNETSPTQVPPASSRHGRTAGKTPAPRRLLLVIDDVVTALAARVERRGVHHQQRGLHGIAQLDQFAREPAAAIEALNLLAQLHEDAARARKA